MPRPTDERGITETLIHVYNRISGIVQPFRDNKKWRLENKTVDILTMNVLEIRQLKKDVIALEKKLNKLIEIENLKGK